MAPDPTQTTQPVQPSQAPSIDSAQALTQPTQDAPVQQAPPAQQQPMQPMLSNPGATVQRPPAPKGVDPSNPNAYHPSVMRAGVIHTIAEALAGGKRTSTTIDPNTGTATREEVPLSTGQIGMAIALEAVGGSLAGFSVPNGPGNLGRAAGAAGAQAMDQAQQAKQQQEQQSQQDFVRQYQTMKANLQMRNLALQTGKMDLDSHQSLVSNSAQQLALLKDSSPESIAGQNLSEQEAQDLQQYPITDYYRLPDGVVPRLDANGQPVYTLGSGRVVDKDAPGAIQAYDNTYSMISKGARIPATTDDGKPADWVKQSTSWGLLPKSWLKATGSSTVPASVAASFSHAVTTLQQTAGDLDHFYGTLGQQNPVDLHSAVLQDRSLAKAVEKFAPMLAASNHNYEAALTALNKVSVQYAGQIAQLYGGPENIKLMDARTAHVDTENNLRTNGFKNQAEAEQAYANPNSSPDVKQAAKSYLDTDVSVEGRKAGAKKAAEFPYSAEARERATGGSGNDTVQNLAESIAQGNGTLDTISDRKTKAAVEAYLTVHHPNLDRNSVTLTNDERKKKQLADSDLLNLGIIKDVITKRPDLIGAIQGRISSGKWEAGSNDADLARLKVAADQYGLASIGIHSSRSYQNKEDAVHGITNNLKNGPQAILGAIQVAQQSAGVFANAGKPRGTNGSDYIVTPKPQGPGQVIDMGTATKYVKKYGSPAAAQAAAQRDGWTLPTGSK